MSRSSTQRTSGKSRCFCYSRYRVHSSPANLAVRRAQKAHHSQASRLGFPTRPRSGNHRSTPSTRHLELPIPAEYFSFANRRARGGYHFHILQAQSPTAFRVTSSTGKRKWWSLQTSRIADETHFVQPPLLVEMPPLPSTSGWTVFARGRLSSEFRLEDDFRTFCLVADFSKGAFHGGKI